MKFLSKQVLGASEVSRIRSELTFTSDDDTIEGYYDTDTHLVVPREYTTSVPVEDLRQPPKSFSDMESTVDTFLDNDQEAAWDALKDSTGGLLSIPGGRGKTVLAAMLIARRQKEAIVVLPTLSIIGGWKDELMSKIGVREQDIGVYVGGSKDSELSKPIVLASLDSLINKAPAITFSSRSRRGTVIFDEAHHLGTRTHILVASMFHGERYAFSATPGRPDGRMPMYAHHCGPVIYWSTHHSMSPIIVFKRVDTTTSITDTKVLDIFGKFNFPRYWTALGKEEGFNRLILADTKEALARGRVPMVFTHSVDHAKLLHGAFSHMGHSTGIINGTVKWQKRRDELLKHDVVIGTMGAAHEGLNRLDLDFVLVSMPVGRQGEARFLQTVWRSLRRKEKTPIILVYVPKTEPCLAMERIMRDYANQQGWETKSTDSSLGELSKMPVTSGEKAYGGGSRSPEPTSRFCWRGPRRMGG